MLYSVAFYLYVFFLFLILIASLVLINKWLWIKMIKCNCPFNKRFSTGSHPALNAHISVTLTCKHRKSVLPSNTRLRWCTRYRIAPKARSARRCSSAAVETPPCSASGAALCCWASEQWTGRPVPPHQSRSWMRWRAAEGCLHTNITIHTYIERYYREIVYPVSHTERIEEMKSQLEFKCIWLQGQCTLMHMTVNVAELAKRLFHPQTLNRILKSPKKNNAVFNTVFKVY